MLDLHHVDLIVGFMRAYLLDPDNSFFEIDRHHQPIVIALDVEDDTP
jgi:hypothetical protein